MAEPTPPVVSCGCEIVGWFVLDHVFGTTPMIMNTVHSEVLQVMEIIKSAPSKSVADYATYKHYKHSDWGTVSDFYYDWDKSWHIEVWGDEKKYSPVHSILCEDRSAISALAMLISQRMPEHEVRLQRWARIRCVWKDQKRIRDFPQVPYTNVDRWDWV